MNVIYHAQLSYLGLVTLLDSIREFDAPLGPNI
jgi:hypothetical protein